MSNLDALDELAAEAFEGYLVRKDLAQQFRGQYPVPTYVGEFLLGRYCATTDPAEIAEGLAIVERSMKERTVRAGEEELFKSRAREKGRVKIIDLLRARLDTKAGRKPQAHGWLTRRQREPSSRMKVTGWRSGGNPAVTCIQIVTQ